MYSSSFAHFNYNNILVSGHVFQLKLLQQNKLNIYKFHTHPIRLWDTGAGTIDTLVQKS